jgi:5-dehydro-4-deoxyglucarate dehydratase
VSEVRWQDGVLFFPVTPFGDGGRVDHDLLARHVDEGVGHGTGAVFAACGTGEFHALSGSEVEAVTGTSVRAVAGRVPVIAGAGGPLAHAMRCARGAERQGADALLVLPPYLVTAPQRGLVDYVLAVAGASALPVIVYHRGAAQFTVESMRRLLEEPKLIGIKDGVGDVALAQRFVLEARRAGRDDVQFFNGLLTAELSQAAYRAVGVPLYSSAVFAMAPAIANAFYRAYRAEDAAAQARLLDGFYAPLVALRDETPGFAVSLIKAGLRLRGLPVGGVRAPLVDPDERQTARLDDLLRAGEALIG